MLVPGFSNTNMFVGGVVFFGPSNDEGEFLDLDPEWDKKLFPAIPVEPLT